MAVPDKVNGIIARQEVEHLGFVYDLRDICSKVEAGMKLRDAIEATYPDTPAARVKSLATKINKHPYYVARKDVSLQIIREKGGDLQQHALNLAFGARSEIVQADMTKDLMNRVYGDAGKADDGETPTFVFNFDMRTGPVSAKTTDSRGNVIEGEVVVNGDGN